MYRVNSCYHANKEIVSEKLTNSMEHQHKVFDVAILGAGLGGLIAATRLAKENRSVLLLKEKRYRSSYSRDGYRFVPFSNFSEKLIQTNLPKKIPFPADHRESKKGGDKPKQEVSFQVILPEARIDLYGERSLLQREWRREFPEELNQIENFYAELERIKQVLKEIRSKAPPGPHFPIWNRSFLKRWLSFDGLPKGGTDQWLSPFSPEFKKFIELQMISHGNLRADSFPIPLVSHLLLDGEGDEWEESVDLEKVTEGMIEKFTQSGGKVEEIESVEKVEMKWREGVSVFLKGGKPTYRSRSLVLNSPLHSLLGLFGKKGKALSRWGKKVRPRYVLVPFFLGIHEKVIPVGMRDRLVSLYDLQKPYEGGNLLFLRLSRKGDKNQAPEGKRALTVQSLMSCGGLQKDSISDLQDGVMNHLKHLFPFLENHIEFIDRKWADDQMDCWSYPHFLYEVDSDFRWRRGIVPIRISKNLYFSGRENFPYLGLEGEMISGWLVGEEISGR
ncbi:MAG: NAD(P)/FAD-dependent oxidoreductase [Deltaproteobacteria bacterium]|nr:NAD(P)/FAD-dependent oxidoreductase [Deltaproteobacteria bacterium]